MVKIKERRGRKDKPHETVYFRAGRKLWVEFSYSPGHSEGGRDKRNG